MFRQRLYTPLFTLTIGLLAPPAWAEVDPNAYKAAPKRPSLEADIVVESTEIMEDCAEEKICVEGQLYNAGGKPANSVALRIEIGGTKHTKPRTVFSSKVEEPVMDPGDRQDFSLMINRKVKYKENGKEKVIEVGRYNFKIVPTWAKRRRF